MRCIELVEMGCQKLTYYPRFEMLKSVSKKELTSKNSSKNVRSVYFYGFQGQEKDDEMKGDGNSVNYKYRMHDPRIGRFFAVDPMTTKYPFYSPYAFSGNRVLDAIELEGLQPGILFPSSYSYEQMSIQNKLLTSNWQAYNTNNWSEMKSSIIQFKAQNVNQKILYVYIQLHGNALGCVVGPKQDQTNFSLTSDFGITVTPFDLKEYVSYKSKGAEKYKKFNKGATYKEREGNTVTTRTYDYWADNVGANLEVMFGLFDELPDGTTVIFGACNTGSAVEFLKLLYQATGSRLNFIANTGTTIVTGNILDVPISSCSNVLGWVILGESTNGMIQNVTNTNEEGFVQLTSEGESPIINTEEPCPQD